jgi:hypothetical protein
VSAPAPLPPASGDDDASTVLAALTRGGAKGFSVTIGIVHRTLELICLAAAATGLFALVLGFWAWHSSLPGAAIAVIGGGATLAVAIYVLIRIRAMAVAIKHPTESLAQAQDLVLRAKGSPELHKLAGRVRARKAAKAAGLSRMRRAFTTGKLISSVIGLASPDPVEHRNLVPFRPDRLKFLWLAILVGLWAWLISAVIASLAFLSLAIQSL